MCGVVVYYSNNKTDDDFFFTVAPGKEPNKMVCWCNGFQKQHRGTVLPG
jgi:hypothetical protein